MSVDIENCKAANIQGAKCPKGTAYAIAEAENPTRVLTSTVLSSGLSLKLVPVRTDKPIPKKPAETRMGKGKGMPEGWVAVVKPGRVMFELSGVPEEMAREALRLASHKLPIKTKFVERLGGT